MNLCIDQGNSRTKVALFDQERLLKSFVYKNFSSADAEKLFALYPIGDCIISSVAHTEPAVLNVLNRLSQHFVLFDHTTPVPIVNAYDTPQTLGQDRLAAAVGAVSLCKDQNLLIIDAGSAITYDFVDAQAHYLGGNIAPGIKMRLSVLHQRTKRLPLVEVEENELLPLFGKNTKDAIRAGVLRGVAFEAKGYIRTLQERGLAFAVFLTGGHAPFLMASLNNEPIRLEKNLVLIGLNEILRFVTRTHTKQ